MLNWQNNNTSSLLQILSRWNHKCTVLFWAPMVQSKRVEYYDHFLRNNVSHRDHLFLQGRIQFKKSTEKKIPEPLWFLFICFVLSSENQDELSLHPLPSSQLQSWTYIPPLNSTQEGWASIPPQHTWAKILAAHVQGLQYTATLKPVVLFSTQRYLNGSKFPNELTKPGE